MTHQGRALKQAIKAKSLIQQDFADKMGISRNYLLILFDKAELPEKYLRPAEKLLGIDLTNAQSVAEPEVNYGSKPGNIIHVPLHAFGGFLVGYQNKVYVDSLEHYSLPGVTGEHYSFEVEGMSMYKKGDERSMKSGDWVITKEIEKLEWMTKGKPYVLATTDGIIVKIFDRISGEKAHFHSLNEEYDGLDLPLKSIKRAYFVTQILKKT